MDKQLNAGPDAEFASGPFHRVENAAAGRVDHWLWLGCTVAAAVVAYAPAARWVAGDWMTADSNGLLVGAVFLWLLWRKRRDFLCAETSRSRWGLPVLGVSILALMAATWTGFRIVAAATAVPAAAGAILALRGPGALRTIRFPLVFFAAFGIPILASAELSTGLINRMTYLATAATTVTTGWLGLQPIQKDLFIFLPNYRMHVATTCSGLASMVALMPIAALVSHLGGATARWTVLMVLIAIPVALAVNVVRLTITALLGVTCGPALTSGFQHDMAGVFTYILGTIIIFAVPLKRR